MNSSDFQLQVRNTLCAPLTAQSAHEATATPTVDEPPLSNDASAGLLDILQRFQPVSEETAPQDPPASIVEANTEAETQPPSIALEAPASNVELTEPTMRTNSQSADLESAIETSANGAPFRPAGEAGAPTLTPVESSAFNELARQLSERLEREPEPGDMVALAPEAETDQAETTVEAEPPPCGDNTCSRSLINLLPAEILICQPHRLLHANPAFLARLGYPSLRALEDAGGLDALKIEPGNSSTTSALEAGEPVTVSATNPARDPACPIEARLHIIDWDGGCAMALICTPAIAESVTESMEEAESEQPIEPEHANTEDLAAILDTTAMLARVSHEIRSPLNAIIGIAEASERLGELSRERYGEYMKDIRASGERVLSILDELLELSRIETGQLDLTFTNLSLNDLIEACVSVMQPRANRERIIIRTSLAHPLPPVHVDARTARQIALNLISNSIRLAGSGGQVIVSTALTEGGDVALRISDVGHSLSAKDAATTMDLVLTQPPDAPESPGLSLSLTKALVEANRAQFNVRSAPNSGTLIEVAFSLAHG